MNYPFIKCLRSSYITNPYTGERILTNCRDCDACLNSLGKSWSTLCNIMSEDFTYTCFVTLTYDNNHLPYCTFDSEHNCFVVDKPSSWKNPYIDSEGFVYTKNCNLFVNSYSNISNLSNLLNKCNLNGKIPVLKKQDAQKFLKRLRYYLKSYGIYEKIEYYLIGEYGLEHFRSHFHGLFYFNDKRTFAVFRQALYKAWKNGYLYIEYTQSASNYVSMYLNKFTSLPSLLQTPAFKPFRLHSTRFAASAYQKMQKSLYEYDNRLLIERIVKINDKQQRLSIWRNVTNIFYPKVRGFNRADDYTLYRLYSCYRFARAYFAELFKGKYLTITEMSCLLAELQPKFFDFLTFDNIKMEFRSPDNIARDLYTSKHFLERVLPYANITYTCSYIQKFKKFYSDLELYRLGNFYRNQQNNPNIDYHFFYDNFSASHPVYNNPLFSGFFSMQSMIAINSVKHKKLNDKNLLLNYG